MLPTFQIDGNWIDCCAVLHGVAYVTWRAWMTRRSQRSSSATRASDFAFGVALFPQYVLLMCVASSTLIEGLAQSSRISLCIAGSYALAAMWQERRDDHALTH